MRSFISTTTRRALTARRSLAGTPSHHFSTSPSTPRPRKARAILQESNADPDVPASSIDSIPSLPVEEPTTGRKSRASASASSPPPSKDAPTSSTPTSHDYLRQTLWSPTDPLPSTASSSALPPSHLLEDAIDNLLITLQPQVQHRAAYAPAPGNSLLEPTLALYCPIEGGDYVIDETVKEMARRVGADVVVLDSVQLAAGEWGKLGKGSYQ